MPRPIRSWCSGGRTGSRSRRTLRTSSPRTAFLAQGGDGFIGFDAGRNLAIHSELVRDAIAATIEAETQAGRKIDPDPEPRLERPDAARR
jgi:hypothetical protein